MDEAQTEFGAIKVSSFSSETIKKINEFPFSQDDWKKILKIYPLELWENKSPDLPAVFGTYNFTDSILFFKPRFPFREGKEYKVELHLLELPDAGYDILLKNISVPIIHEFEPTYITEIFPTSDQLPANQLKIYLHFSNPIGLGNIYEHIKLLDEKDEEIIKPFLELDPPLWDKNHIRLTLWFDPGRIKSHLGPNQKLGPPLNAEKKYTLIVSKKIKDIHGYFLKNDFKKQFKTISPDHNKPNPAEWQIKQPKVNSRTALMVDFPEPMDRGTLESGIAVFDKNENQIVGKIKTALFEKSWMFIPDEPWQSGSYKIKLSERLEDLAGNNLKRLFDHKIGNGDMAKKSTPTLELFFTIKED